MEKRGILDIGTVAKRSGVAVSTLRYYEEKSLITPVARAGLRRQYDAAVLDQLALINLAQMAGFSLSEIAGMVGTNGDMRIERTTLLARAERIKEQADELKRLQQILLHVANCPEEDHFKCDKFQQLLHLAPRFKRKAKQQI